MSEVEKQEGQKTVVAFITGLLIGGLLVWVFSSSPEVAPTDKGDGTQTEESTSGVKGDDTTLSTDTTVKTNTEIKKPEVTGDGKLVVANQKAGASVSLSDVQFPTDSGWVVVRDYVDGVSGSVLGAARYNTVDGLLPKEVTLLRSTEKDKTYQVVFFTESGDMKFSSKDDRMIDGTAVTFKAN
jgi:hypothetical protein